MAVFWRRQLARPATLPPFWKNSPQSRLKNFLAKLSLLIHYLWPFFRVEMFLHITDFDFDTKSDSSYPFFYLKIGAENLSYFYLTEKSRALPLFYAPAVHLVKKTFSILTHFLVINGLFSYLKRCIRSQNIISTRGVAQTSWGCGRNFNEKSQHLYEMWRYKLSLVAHYCVWLCATYITIVWVSNLEWDVFLNRCSFG